MQTVAAQPDKRAFTIEDFRSAYRIGRTRIYEEIAAGRLKARQVGGRTLIAAEDADRWFSSFPIKQARAA